MDVGLVASVVTVLAYGGITPRDIVEFLTSLWGLVVLSSSVITTLLVRLLRHRKVPEAPPSAEPVPPVAPPEVVLLRKTTTRERTFLGIVATKTTEMVEELAPNKVVGLLLVSVSAIALVGVFLSGQEPVRDQPPEPTRGSIQRPSLQPTEDPYSPSQQPPLPPGIDGQGMQPDAGGNEDSASAFFTSVPEVITGAAALITVIAGGYLVWRSDRK